MSSESIDKFLKAMSGEENEKDPVKILGMQSITGKVNTANAITARISNKILNDVINDAFKVKQRHKVEHV